jgi:hypothetical protein
LDQLTRANTKLISSIDEPVYTIPYVTAQARNGLMNVSASNLSLAIAGNVICRIQNNSAKLLTSIESNC